MTPKLSEKLNMNRKGKRGPTADTSKAMAAKMPPNIISPQTKVTIGSSRISAATIGNNTIFHSTRADVTNTG